MTSMDAALKQLYAMKRVQDLTYKRNPLLAMVPKFTRFGGRNMPIVNTVTHPQGVSANFAIAQGNKTAANLQDFLLTRRKKYSVASVDGETAEASKGDAFAFLSALSVQVDGALRSLARNVAIDLPRNGGGSIGTIAVYTGGLTPSFTLTNPSEVVNFEVGMVLVADTNDGTGTSGSVGTATSVISVDRDNGEIFLATDAGWAATNFVFRQGDFGAALLGLEAWIPQVRPTAGDNFLGVDRSQDNRLSGQRFDGTGLTIQEALIGGQSLAAREGGAVSHAFINHAKMRDLINELGAKVVYDRAQAFDAAHIGFRSVVVDGDFGPIQVVADSTIPDNVAWLLQLDTWKLCTLGDVARILMLDGNRVLRQALEDGYEVRCGTYGNLSTHAPGFNCRVTLTP
jgi:hypothetical protein